MLLYMKTKKKKNNNNKTRKSVTNIYFYKTPPKTTTINGFKFIFLPVKCGTFQIECKVFGGNYLENPDNLGISHLLEHMITEAWKKCYKTGCVEYMEKYGIINNAYTTNISTGYWIKGLSQYQNFMIEYMLSTILEPHITAKNMKDEIEAVRNEITQKINDPNYKLLNYTSNILYNNFGLKNSINFTKQLKNLKNFTIEQLREFTHTIISQKRIMFFISGFYNKDKTITIINNIFKKIPYNNFFDIRANIDFNLCYNVEKSIHFVENKKNRNSTIIISFPLPIYQGDKILLYLPLITKIMGSGLNSLLLKSIANKG